MSKSLINFWLDVVLLLITTTLLLVTAIVRFAFPAPSAAEGWRLLGYDYDAWSNLQFGVICVLAAALVLHIMLHWSWVCGIVSTQLLGRRGTESRLDDGTRTLYGVGLLVVVVTVLGLLLGLSVLLMERPGTTAGERAVTRATK
jgi:hypothetical protein